jgi:hypothetical protein
MVMSGICYLRCSHRLVLGKQQKQFLTSSQRLTFAILSPSPVRSRAEPNMRKISDSSDVLSKDRTNPVNSLRSSTPSPFSSKL